MTQGRALEVLTHAHNLTREQKYLDTAKLLLNSFFVEVKDGGVTYKTPNKGWWYEHYADDDAYGRQEPRVLNAMLFTVLGIYEYYNYTHDPLAEFLFYQGILALKNDLPKYDKNGEALYDALGRKAGTFYLPVQTRLLSELYDLTGEPVFKKYHDLWGADFILTQYSGMKMEDVYVDYCINQQGLFNINVHLDNASRVLNLLDKQNYVWKAEDDAEVIQNDSGLSIKVDTDKGDKTYNRAYLQAELNFPDLRDENDREKPLLLSLDYVAESKEGNATFAGDMIEIGNDAQNSSNFTFPLQSQAEEGRITSEIFVVPKNMTNKLIELRLFVITDEPGSHSLNIEKANILSGVPVDVMSIF